MMSIDDPINKLTYLMENENIGQNKSTNWTNYSLNDVLNNLDSNASHIIYLSALEWAAKYHKPTETDFNYILLVSYCLIVIISFFGNSIVCKIIFWNAEMRSTTNIFIGNLSISDLLITVFNIPLQLIQHILRNSPLNRFFCKSMPFFQGLSVNVSSFTITCIALDRYQVIAYPLKPRPGMSTIILKLIFIWTVAIIAASPYPSMAEVVEDFTDGIVTRCRLIYPKPEFETRQAMTMIIMFTQYLGPLCITGFTYYRICSIIWNRQSIGVMSEIQRNRRYKAKWKTIKMLIIVFIVFATCWFPLNIYHAIQDFRGVVGTNKHNSTLFLFCHWFAMSSICYNPFIYCWLNDKFRDKAKACIFWLLRIKCGSESHLTKANKRIKTKNSFLKKSSLMNTSKLSYRSKLVQLSSTKLLEKDIVEQHLQSMEKGEKSDIMSMDALINNETNLEVFLESNISKLEKETKL